ncbi:SWI/SNF-related matrix-associated actin-dependent regulator of chromatin subfamily A containing DEAD/H box 1A [Eucyclogobius newberryi]|uniref:SWI/SNF-related matrix-associated actin-dependent regulator of chromatin subfamily A containing DEAD/H box 1A n=1 Tax=Eucyclogobius newberryi TaxID=166745 RepID=UPI003B5B42D8
MFNLDRFRFDKNAKTPKKDEASKEDPKTPDSEKENKPAKAQPLKPPSKPSAAGVVYLDTESDENEDIVFVSEVASPNSKTSSTTKSTDSSKQTTKDSKETSSPDLEEKINKLLAMFPQLNRDQVKEVIESTSTLEGAVATCLLKFGDDDRSMKRKKAGSSSSKDTDVQPSKKSKSSSVDVEDWDKREDQVRRLQRKFPDQDKEELRSVLEEHDWKYSEALLALQMFSDPENTSSSHESGPKDDETDNSDDGQVTEDEGSFVSEDKPSSVSKSKDKTHNDRDANSRSCFTTAISDSDDNNSDVSNETKNSSDSQSEEEELKSKLQNSQRIKRDVKAAQLPKPSLQSRLTSAISLAKKAAEERKRRVQANASANDCSSEEEEEDDDDDSSDYDNSDDELETQKGPTDMKTEMLRFFNDATVDELTLISGCSVKKAQKIIELRPFDCWDSLGDHIHKDNGLSEDLLFGCKIVLKERKVVLGLMSRCETISSKLIKQVSEVMKNNTCSTKQPKLLAPHLRLKPYQVIGLKWLMLLNEHKLSCILADEMGLGKTIQAIAFLAQLYENGVTGPHLIVVPASTLDNWDRELKLWCPKLNVVVYYGSAEDRRYLKYDILNGDIELDVIVTTYNLAIGNDSDRSLFRKLRLVYAIFDEGHMLKNMNTLRYRHLMAINAKHRVLLTGTPVQNNLLELMSLLNFIMPSMFSDSTTQLSKMFSMKSSEGESKFEKQRISQAKRIMKPFILRRVKTEVLKQLPAKEEAVEYCSMSERQEELYQELFKKLKKTVPGEKREMCNAMMQLRKMANHPLLHRHRYTLEKLKVMSRLMLKEPTHFDADAALIQEDMEAMSDFELHNLCKRYSSLSSYQLETDVILDSGKFKHLTDLLSTIKEKGDRVVLFSQFTMMLDIVEVFLKYHNHGYVRLDGSTPIADRIVLIDKYNTDKDIFVFLLSTRAGGLGINLTSANVVILHDIDCNPYNDKQAEDRCHRVGQTKTVQVIKLISKDSIEACILKLGLRKLKLEQDMTAADATGEGTITEDMASLLKATLGL